MEEQIISALTGPFSALVLAVAILYWVANKALPIVQKYLEDQNNKLGEMVKALEKTVESHEADRHVFESAITKLSKRLDRVEDDISDIKEKLS
jgi:septal ring factor EnvC (AmiA/AmiB activator)